jgi:hypothetical protein
MSKKSFLKVGAIGLLLCSAGSAWALPPGLSRNSSTWFEVGFVAAWGPSRAESMIGWRFSFSIGSPIAFNTTIMLSGTGAYGTVGCTYFYDRSTVGSDVTFPIGAGIGFSRRNEDLSYALVFSGGASWYPISIDAISPKEWLIGFGTELDASLYLVSWGIEPVLSGHLLMPFNLSRADAAPQ